MRKRSERIAVYAALIALTVVFLFPLAWIVGLSLKTRLQVFASPPLFVWRPTFENYIATLGRADFGQAFINSLVVSAGAVSLSLIVGVPAAYALARFRFAGRTVMFFALLAMHWRGSRLPAATSCSLPCWRCACCRRSPCWCRCTCCLVRSD
jgi:multiple sugar transport system permease protein